MFANRVLGFDMVSASIFADLAATCQRARRPISLADGQMASICLAHSASLVTRNEKDFVNLDLKVIHPRNAVVS